jgi:hypothetical protein
LLWICISLLGCDTVGAFKWKAKRLIFNATILKAEECSTLPNRYEFLIPFLCSFGENLPSDSEFQKFERFYCCVYDPSYRDRKVDTILIVDGVSNNDPEIDSSEPSMHVVDYVDDINLVRNENFWTLSTKGKKKTKTKVFSLSFD